ncbi:molybdopterin-binding/glycosyltransferase family 2 protein [Elioraea sp.]|uniref:molybdopterin-binding/glycosyltransferase family 2 protein n=1 Tax=Elioraea sp. TaxID=2185103 RepID=UPI0025C20A4A|nr:molybdopterin-binding/glycosyltransferase family 2 protein [Elioraea sp.]
MIFGRMRVADAAGAILAHTLKAGQRTLKKGRALADDDIAELTAAGIEMIVAARLEPGDLGEDEAAARIAEACRGAAIRATRAATGRVNLVAEAAGVLAVDAVRLDRLNRVDEALTVATLPPYAMVEAGDMLATIKIIPFAAPEAAVADAAAIAAEGGALLSLHPFAARPVGLVMTRLPGMKESILDGTEAVTRARIEALGATLLPARRVGHTEEEVAAALAALAAEGARVLLVSGASAVVDRRDVCPAGIVAAGGSLDHFGMPVDPGNLLCFGTLGDIPAVVLPGCARSPKLNGFDWVLQRLMADLPIGRPEIMAMGAGGLLKEIETRPLPRARAPDQGRERPHFREKPGRRIGALVLAAGRSSRMAPNNKLLITDAEGVPMVARVVEAVLASPARPVMVVTGHAEQAVQGALAGRNVRFVHNPAFAQGLSSSLRAGIDALGDEVDAVLVCLGDMPLVSAALLGRLIAAYDPEEGRAIVVPTVAGRQGNPVLWDRRFFAAMRAVTGDVGARHLVGENTEAVHEVAMEDDAALTDFDTPESLAAAPDLFGTR